jgi:hypothetical protein
LRTFEKRPSKSSRGMGAGTGEAGELISRDAAVFNRVRIHRQQPAVGMTIDCASRFPPDPRRVPLYDRLPETASYWGAYWRPHRPCPGRSNFSLAGHRTPPAYAPQLRHPPHPPVPRQQRGPGLCGPRRSHHHRPARGESWDCSSGWRFDAKAYLGNPDVLRRLLTALFSPSNGSGGTTSCDCRETDLRA